MAAEVAATIAPEALAGMDRLRRHDGSHAPPPRGGHLLDAPGWRLLVAEPAAALAGQQASGEITDDRTALRFMRSALDRLVEG